VEDAVTDQHGFAGAAFRVLESAKLGWDHVSVNSGQAGPGIVKITPIAAQKTPTDTGERRATQCRATQCRQHHAAPRDPGTSHHDLTVKPDPNADQRTRSR
jgi:hypothetical protein